jgi:citrate lyase subunit beta/citryl-CoA lyase
VKHIRSLLCVPAHKPELYAKAEATDADCLMYDLEDSTPQHHKHAAALALSAHLQHLRPHGKVVAVRVNPFEVSEHQTFGDLADVLVIPKVKDEADLRFVRSIVPFKPLLPVVETPQAILNLRSILGFPSVVGVIFGVADYAAGMGVSDRTFGHGWVDLGPVTNTRFAYAKQKIATYCAAFGKQSLDTCFNVRDRSMVEQTWVGSRSIGFTGAAAIHPMQVGVANELFGPSVEEQTWALATHEGHAYRNGEVGVDDTGLVVGMPVDRQARAIIARSNQ